MASAVAGFTSTAMGTVKWKAVPCGVRADAHKRPPCASMIDRQIESPMPRPSDLVVKKGSKMRCAMAGSSPGPVSSTVTCGTVRLGEGDGDGQLPFAVRDRCHGLDAVHDQVQQHLLQLNLVAQHGLRAGGQIGVQHDAVLLQFAAGERQHFLDGVADVELGQLRPGFLGERPQAADHVAGTVSLPHDARDGIPRRGKVRLVPVQPAQTGAAAGRDGGQGLVDLMGDGGEQFAHRRQPRDAGEFRLGVSQRLLGALCAR